MSTPTGDDRPDDQNPDLTGASDATSPEAATPEAPAPEAAPDAPTAAYPAGLGDEPPVAPAAPTAPYGQPAAPQGYGQPQAQQPYGQQPYGQQPYGQAGYAAPAPSGPDTRPKTMATVSLGLAVLGVILACVGFVPVAWVGLVSVLIGGLALIVAFILSIVALASRKQGGKPFGIIALVLSVVGGVLWGVALFVSIALTAITASNEASPPAAVESPAPADPGQTEGETDGDGTEGENVAGDYDEAAFLAEARPAIVDVFTEVDPTASEEIINQLFSDESLVSMGKSFLMVGDAGRQPMIDGLMESGTFNEDTASRFVDAILDAAKKHLQE